MYYSENVRKKKVKELENNKEFMDYAKERFEDYSFGAKTFDEYLLKQVFDLYDNFEMLQFLKTSDQQTIDKVLVQALKGLEI